MSGTTRADGVDGDDPVAALRAADQRRQRASERVRAAGEDDLRALADAIEELRGLLDRYEEPATGSGDFEQFIAFQDAIGRFTEDLPEDLLERETFETIDDELQQRRLTSDDFERVRSLLADAAATTDPLEELAEAREDYADARLALRRERDAVTDRIEELEELQRLGDADLDAPVERLADPIERYDDAVTDAFETFRADEPASDVLAWVRTTRHYPLVDYRQPPSDLLAYLTDADAGDESIPQLLTYADYSPSKLAHYVDDADAFKRAVATNATYLRRLDATPLTVGWPPPDRGVCRYRCEALIAVVGRFAPDLVPALRDVRALTRREDYDRLREAARARDQLGPEERERLRDGRVERELADARDERERIDDALAEFPSLDDLEA